MTDVVDLNVVNGRIVTPNGIVSGGVSVLDGQIVDVGSTTRLPDADEVVDAEGNYVLPGCIDPHCHIGLPGFQEDFLGSLEQEFETETRGAVHAGVTTVINFLLNDEPYLPDLDAVRETGERNSYIDFAFHAILYGNQHIEEMEGLAEEGIRSFKVFFNMYKNTATQLGIPSTEVGDLYEVLQRVSEIRNGIVLVHAENDDLNQKVKPEMKEQGEDLEAWAKASPKVGEAMQIDQLARLTDFTDSRAYVVHVSSDAGVDVIEEYQDQGVDIRGETLAGFLGLNYAEDLDVFAQVNPPVRGPASQKRLWEGLRTGVLEHVGTDHVSPAIAGGMDREAVREAGVWEARVGRPGMGYLLPVLLSEGVNKNRISIQRVAEVVSTNNAKTFGLYPQKGAISEGSDADMVIVDLDKSATVDDDFYHTSDPSWSAFHGREFTGLPTHTIVGGEVVVSDGDLQADKGGRDYVPQRPGTS